MANLQRNIWVMHIIKAARWLKLSMLIVYLFMLDHGLTMVDLMLLQAAYNMTTAAMEIPSGVLADRMGRRFSIILSTFFTFGGFLIYGLPMLSGFWIFIIAEVLLGLGTSLISGTDSAIIYDTLVTQRREKQYLRIDGANVGIGNVAEALAGIVGGLVAFYFSLQMPYQVQAIIAFATIFMAFLLIEPPVFKQASKKLDFKKFSSKGIDAFRASPTLKWYILLSSVTGLCTLFMAWFMLPFMEHINLTEKNHGYVWAALNTLIAIMAFLVHKMMRWSRKWLTISLAVIFIVGIIGTGLLMDYRAFFFIALFYLARGAATPLFRQFINDLTPTEVRATILSVRSFVIRAAFAGVSVGLALIMKYKGLSTTLLIAGAIFGSSMLLVCWFLFNPKQQTIPAEDSVDA